MEQIFVKILNMSISASILIGVIVLLRLALRKTPRWIFCILWALVGIRLVCPISFESKFSLQPGEDLFVMGNRTAQTELSETNHNSENLPGNAEISVLEMHDGVEINTLETHDNTDIEVSEKTDSVEINATETTDIIQDLPNAVNVGAIGEWKDDTDFIREVRGGIVTGMSLFTVLWLIGMIGVLIYGARNYYKVWRKIRFAVTTDKKIYLCDYIDTPFIFGVIRPRIYLPSALDADKADNIIAHEKAHLQRGDHLWKPLGFAVLSVYWFNPLCWVAYALFCRDIELACDERVAVRMDIEQKKTYSKVLLEFSETRRMISVCPLAFGEIGVKQRVKSILNFKKPSVWVVTLSLAVCAVVAVCFLTSPAAEKTNEKDLNEEVEKNQEIEMSSKADNEQQEQNSEIIASESYDSIKISYIKSERVENDASSNNAMNGTDSTPNDIPKVEWDLENYKGEPCDMFEKMAGGYWYLSGSGGWQTRMVLNADGTFYGIYEDQNADCTYRCEFDGVMKAPSPIPGNDYVYCTSIVSLHYAAPGYTWEEAGHKIVTAKPVGLEDSPSLYIYVPGTPISTLTNIEYAYLRAEQEEFWNKSQEEAMEEVLPCYMIRQVDGDGYFTKAPYKAYYSGEFVNSSPKDSNIIQYGDCKIEAQGYVFDGQTLFFEYRVYGDTEAAKHIIVTTENQAFETSYYKMGDSFNRTQTGDSEEETVTFMRAFIRLKEASDTVRVTVRKDYESSNGSVLFELVRNEEPGKYTAEYTVN